MKRLCYFSILAILVCFTKAALKCTAKLIYVDTSNSQEVELTLTQVRLDKLIGDWKVYA